jgi:heme o synthase
MNSEVKTLDATSIRTRSKVADFVELMKPELTGLSAMTTVCGFYLATTGTINGWLLFHTALGTLLVGGGAGALNQYIERHFDALMKRTERRPLPAGRLMPGEVLLFGAVLSLLGILELTIMANVLTGFLAAVTWSSYLFLYTPLKRVTPLSTVIGGIPGALPPMMGWTAVRNELSVESFILFAILFCWQMPHFFSLAWMYRRDYARAGFKILTVNDPDGKKTSRQILWYSAALIPLSLAPTVFKMTGHASTAGAVALSVGFLSLGILLSRCSHQDIPDTLGKINIHSRRLFFASLIYLPALLLLMTLDKM